MEVKLINVAKQFGRETVFSGVHCVVGTGSRTAILGPNGSGKSTLLQVIAGALVPTTGTVQHTIGERPIDPDEVYRYVSIAAPYLNLYEDLSLRQTIATHARFKPLRRGITVEELARTAYLDAHLDKPVRNFSSGMKQRLKLALAILSDAPLLLLDEPASNLDAQGIAWYANVLAAHLDDRTVMVASNNEAAETGLCDTRIAISAWKR